MGILIATVGLAQATQVNLIGKITTVENGLLVPVESAKVQLTQRLLTTNSAKDGSFILAGTVDTAKIDSNTVVLSKASNLNLAKSGQVIVDAYGLNGQKINLLNQRFQAGRVDLNLENLSSRLAEGNYVLKISAEGQVETVRFYHSSHNTWNGFNTAPLTAVDSSGDTLLVSKTGFEDYKQPVASLVGDLDVIVMTPVGGFSSSSSVSSSSSWSSYSYTNTTCLQWLTPYVFDMAFNNSRRHVQHSYQNFIDAMAKVPEFMCKRTMTEAQQKQELAAFFAQLRQETYGLVYIEEICGTKGTCLNTYNTDWSGMYPPVAGKSYHGRGAMQLSWPGNYGQASEYLYKSKTTLLSNPELVMQDGKVSFATAMWFWAVRTEAGGPCSNAYWNTGFGATTKVINGALECGTSYGTAAKYREGYYQNFLTQFGVSDTRAASLGCQ